MRDWQHNVYEFAREQGIYNQITDPDEIVRRGEVFRFLQNVYENWEDITSVYSQL